MNKIIPAVVKYAAGLPRDGQYGPSINILCTPDDGGDDFRIYGKPGEPIDNLRIGTRIKAIELHGKYKLVEYDASNDVQHMAKAEPKQEEDINYADLLVDVIKLHTQNYVKIYSTLLENGVDHEHAASATATVFIQLSKSMEKIGDMKKYVV